MFNQKNQIMKLRKLFWIAAVVSPLILCQGCSKDDDDGGTEIVNGGTTNGDKNSNDGKNTNDDGTNNGSETPTDLTKLDWKVKWDYISDDLFPSFTYMQLISHQFADAPECVSITIPKESEGARIKLTVEGNDFINQTVVE